MNKRPCSGMPVRRRLALWNVCVLAFVLAFLGIAFRMTIRASLTAALDRDMAQRASRAISAWDRLTPQQKIALIEVARLRRLALPGAIGDGLRGPGVAESISAVMGLSADNVPPDVPVYRPRILDLQRRDLVVGTPEQPRDPDAFDRAARGATVFSTVWSGGAPIRVYSSPIHRDGAIIGVLQLARSLVGVQRTVRTITGAMLTFIPVALALAWLGGAFLTDRAIRPVREIRQAMQRIEAKHLSERLPIAGDDEFAELSTTLNQMLERLEAAFAQQQRFTTDASHELRTPLTVIRGNASLALAKERSVSEYRDILTRIARVAETMSGMVDSLLLLARADTGALRPHLAPVRIADVLEDARAATAREDAASITLQIPDPALLAQGDAGQLTRVFTNLLANAVRHTPADGRIVATAATSDDGVIITVQDNGEGIPAEHLPHLGERFYRVDASRNGAAGGTGLGLAICRSIVDAHRGTMEIESKVGEGTRVRVSLPRTIAAS